MSIDIEESLRSARSGSAFSCGTDYADWRGRWCENCLNDAGYREKDVTPVPEAYAGGCPLLVIALTSDRTPAEWFPQESGPDAYHCVMFRSDQDGGSDGHEPEPQPEPDQDGLFERPACRARMLVQTQRSVFAA